MTSWNGEKWRRELMKLVQGSALKDDIHSWINWHLSPFSTSIRAFLGAFFPVLDKALKMHGSFAFADELGILLSKDIDLCAHEAGCFFLRVHVQVPGYSALDFVMQRLIFIFEAATLASGMLDKLLCHNLCSLIFKEERSHGLDLCLQEVDLVAHLRHLGVHLQDLFSQFTNEFGLLLDNLLFSGFGVDSILSSIFNLRVERSLILCKCASLLVDVLNLLVFEWVDWLLISQRNDYDIAFFIVDMLTIGGWDLLHLISFLLGRLPLSICLCSSGWLKPRFRLPQLIICGEDVVHFSELAASFAQLGNIYPLPCVLQGHVLELLKVHALDIKPVVQQEVVQDITQELLILDELWGAERNGAALCSFIFGEHYYYYI